VLKLLEYFAFGVAITLAMSEQVVVRTIIIVLIAYAAIAGTIGVAEILRDHQLGARTDSLMGADPLGLLGAAVITVAIAAPGRIGSTTIRRVAVTSGLLCLLVSGSLSAIVGLGLATLVALVRGLEPFKRLSRATAAVLTVVAICIGGTFIAVRWNDIRAATTQVGGSPAHVVAGGSFTQRLMFADFGLRIWIDHPILGVGFQQSGRLSNWGPYFASVRADFPSLPSTYFPAIPGISFGLPDNNTELNLHNAYSQMLAETGLVGLALFALAFFGATRSSFRRLSTSEIARAGSLLVIVVLGALTRNELYGGLPETAILVIGLALAVVGGRSTVSPRASS
jgi:O-antigen ligase